MYAHRSASSYRRVPNGVSLVLLAALAALPIVAFGSMHEVAAQPVERGQTVPMELPCSVYFPSSGGMTSYIAEKYAALGGPQAFLGNPTFPGEARTPDGIGCFKHFDGGSIYWSPQ